MPVRAFALSPVRQPKRVGNAQTTASESFVTQRLPPIIGRRSNVSTAKRVRQWRDMACWSGLGHIRLISWRRISSRPSFRSVTASLLRSTPPKRYPRMERITTRLSPGRLPGLYSSSGDARRYSCQNGFCISLETSKRVSPMSARSRSLRHSSSYRDLMRCHHTENNFCDSFQKR